MIILSEFDFLIILKNRLIFVFLNQSVKIKNNEKKAVTLERKNNSDY